MGTEPGRATSNRESSAAEGADMISEQTVTRFLNSTPMMACPDDVLARMRRTIHAEPGDSSGLSTNGASGVMRNSPALP